MQIGVGGAAGDAYDQLCHYLADPSLGPHDPTAAVELAALVLTKGKGAHPGQPIDAYTSSITAYNGSGPAAQQYAQRVLADAKSYGADPLPAGARSCQAATVALVAGDTAKILRAATLKPPPTRPPASET
jgi:hypothetical protein